MNQLSRRDQFALAVLTGMLANPECEGQPEDFAQDAIGMADLMIDMLNATVGIPRMETALPDFTCDCPEHPLGD